MYLKVVWKHENNDYPIVLYSELSKDRYEIRKVELFASGTLFYAYDGGSSGQTTLGELSLPSLEDIASDSEFEPVEITQREFDEVWSRARNQ